MTANIKKTGLTPGSDVLRVNKMVFQASHGCSVAEREVGATFTVDVELYFDIHQAAISDNLKDTVDVARVYTLVQTILMGNPRNLVETVAEEIAVTLLQSFSINSVMVRVHKDRAPMAGVTNGYEVEIIR